MVKETLLWVDTEKVNKGDIVLSSGAKQLVQQGFRRSGRLALLFNGLTKN